MKRSTFLLGILLSTNINNIDILILLFHVIYLKVKTKETKRFQHNLIIMEFTTIRHNDTMITTIYCRVGSQRYSFIFCVLQLYDICILKYNHKNLFNANV